MQLALMPETAISGGYFIYILKRIAVPLWGLPDPKVENKSHSKAETEKNAVSIYPRMPALSRLSIACCLARSMTVATCYGGIPVRCNDP